MARERREACLALRGALVHHLDLVTLRVPPKVWRKLERAAQGYFQRAAAAASGGAGAVRSDSRKPAARLKL
jgi:hypothetical protein